MKTGDLAKIRHIAEGVVSENDKDKDSALVFYQFGKYLTKNPGEPIIYQHVLRALRIYLALKDQGSDVQELKTDF